MLETEAWRPESKRVAERSFPAMGYYARVTLTIVGVLVLIAAAWAVRNILILLVIAAVLAVGLDPAVRRLERLKISRGWVLWALAGPIVGPGLLCGPHVVYDWDHRLGVPGLPGPVTHGP